MPNGPSRNVPASRSSSEPNTLGESKRGTHSQSIAPSGATSAPVWQSERNAYSAIGGNGDGAAALCDRGRGHRLRAVAERDSVGVLMTPPTARASRRSSATSSSAAAGPQLPFAYG